jgi:hypothetical protein
MFTTDLAAATGILILATVVEALVEYFLRPLFKPWVEGTPPVASLTAEEGQDPPKKTDDRVTDRDLALRYTAALVGVVLCCVYAVDLLAVAGLVSPMPLVGYVVTGLLIGRGANFVHDFAARWM